jgi:hypothetical protein
MPATFIDTKKCSRQTLKEASGQVAEVVNAKLCGAKNVLAMLRWLDRGETFDVGPLHSSRGEGIPSRKRSGRLSRAQ